MRASKSATVAAATVMTLLAAAAPAHAADGGTRESHVTAVGVHNTYDRAVFPHLADALDAGPGLIELDVWVFSGAGKWRVTHDLPLVGANYGQKNNCMSGGLRTGSANQLLNVCLDNIRLWHDQHPGHRPVVVKMEMKNGFNVQAGASATDFDNLVRGKLGAAALFTPGDLLADRKTLDEAAEADTWPTRDALAGRFIFEIIPGTFELQNPFDHLKTDVEYGRHVRDAPKTAVAFPAVLGAQAGDPRTRFGEASIRPWFVVFDGAAAAYVDGGIDTAWYDDNHYLLVMTGAHEVKPALDDLNPAPADARQRVRDLARAHASIVSTDWRGLTDVLPMQVDRG
jgi:hypothetical protein